MTGLNSPYGRRGSICQHFGWTWDYLHHGIAWSIISRIMIDLPAFHSKKDENVKLDDENADDVMNYINNML